MCSKDRSLNILNESVLALKDIKRTIEKNVEDPEIKSDYMEQLKDTVIDFINIHHQVESSWKVHDEMNDQLNAEIAENLDVENVFNEKLNAELEKDINAKNHNYWGEVFGYQDVEEVQPNTQSQNDEIYEEFNDEMMCGSVFTPPVDPISKTIIKEPYKSKHCGHVYEYKFIINYIKNMKNKAKCPYIGCANDKLTLREITKDDVIKKRLEEYFRQHPEAIEGTQEN